MRGSRLAVAGVVVLVGALLPAVPAQAAAGGDGLEVYVGRVSPAQVATLRAAGVDVSEGRSAGGATDVEAVLTGRQAARLAGQGIRLSVKRVHGRPASEVLRAEAARPRAVFRPYSGKGGLREELERTAAANPRLAKLVTVGYSVRGKPILALKVTRDARTLPDGRRPAVLYLSAQHAREWITPEMTRRLMHSILDGYGRDRSITRLVDSTELWFMPVANPDGYDFTFTEGNRLWRKNLRDNNGDGQITGVDGVDPNRNFAYRWGYDEEGSSDDFSADDYRGPAPQSEPETRAADALFRRVGFEFMVDYHSAAQLLLYGVGWQVSTPTPDDLIAEALAGDDAHPAVPGYDPDLGAELYTTNGETDGHISARYGTVPFTPEMSTCATAAASVPDDAWEPDDCVSDFVFPDDERLVAAEVAKNMPFALSVARSAADPANPVSSLGRTTPNFVVDAFPVSYGRTQPVAAIVRRSLRDVRLNYRVNGGRTRSVGVREWRGGERYGNENNRYFAEMRGLVTGTGPGDRVEAWFSARRVADSTHFRYRVSTDIGGDVLVLAAEDVTGISPVQTGTSAKYATTYATALNHAGYRTDTYDVDAMGRQAPHPLGVLSHYKAVVWETGDDVIPRATGQPAGTTTKGALDTELAVRDYLNEGGKVLVSGQYALFAQAANSYAYNPYAPPECADPDDQACLPLLNDFQQYYLGAYTYVEIDQPIPLTGNAGRFTGWTGTPNAPGSANNQTHGAVFLPTASFLPPAQFPQFASAAQATWDRPGPSPYEPIDGSWYVYSGQSNASYKRLTRTLDLTGVSSAALRFAVSYDTEADWDYLFVEAHEVGTDAWTTLADTNGHTSADTGDSCPEGWSDIHPFLAHYQGADCSPTGTTGSWNAASGSSEGWTEWNSDLSSFAGKKVEISISYASDWATQGLGVFLDNVRVLSSSTSFETDLGGWTVAGPPPGSAGTRLDWTRSQKAFDEGAVVVTRDTVYTGFGLEGLAPAERDSFIRRAMAHLLAR